MKSEKLLGGTLKIVDAETFFQQPVTAENYSNSG
jgi:hypothetical protein